MLESISWKNFNQSFRWRQGEHLAAVAPTGAGKTTLFAALLARRKFNLFFGTKLDDTLYHQIQRKGYTRIESIDELRSYDSKILLWPKPGKTIAETYYKQRLAFKDALNELVKQGGWTIWLDECKYLAEQLKLEKELTFCLEQLRSINGTVVSGAQRPVWMPRSVLSNASHAFIWRTNDKDDARRLADIAGLDAKLIMNEAKMLNPYEFVYINAREGDIIKSKVERS